ncbi:aldose epimerase family protein [Streptomyces albidoflavus]
MNAPTAPAVRYEPHGYAPDGTPVQRWHLDSGTGTTAAVLTYGGILQHLTVPATDGTRASVVLGLPTAEAYAAARGPYLGALVGRYANRLAHGRFPLDGADHTVPANDRGHALHGGPDGFDRRVWRATPVPAPDAAAVRLTLLSPDGDMGFPGTLEVAVTYRLGADHTLTLDYEARTDRPTVVNLTHHAYFDLTAGPHGLAGHTLRVPGAHYLPVDPGAIPVGPPAPVEGTPFDLREATPLGPRLTPEAVAADPQLAAAGGYDHTWLLDTGPGPDGLRPAAALAALDGSRAMEVWTTEPAVQVYTGNQLDASLTGSDGRPLTRHRAVCLETQHLPDSPNHPEYPSTVLRPGEEFHSRTAYRFPHLGAG